MRTTVLLMSVDEAPLLARSLPAALAQEGADVVVVDNASSDGTAELAQRHGAGYLRLERRMSYCEAMNAALAASGGEAVLLLNADCFLEPGFLAAARPRLEEERVGSVAPKLLRDGVDEIDAAGMVVDRRRKNTLVGHGAPAGSYGEPAEAFGVDGAAALYRRETLEDCAQEGQVFDEDFVMWASDVDLAWRARLLGWRCVYEPRAVGRHIRTYSPSTRAEVSEAHRRLQFRNRYLMIAKNDSARTLLRDAGRVGLYELLALGHVVLRERHLLGGYREAWRLVRRMRGRGRALRARARGTRPPFGLAPPA